MAHSQLKTAHVKLGDVPKEVPAGPTLVSALKDELGVPATDILHLLHGHDQQVLGDDEVLDVKSGMHFDAVPGGTVS